MGKITVEVKINTFVTMTHPKKIHKGFFFFDTDTCISLVVTIISSYDRLTSGLLAITMQLRTLRPQSGRCRLLGLF